MKKPGARNQQDASRRCCLWTIQACLLAYLDPASLPLPRKCRSHLHHHVSSAASAWSAPRDALVSVRSWSVCNRVSSNSQVSGVTVGSPFNSSLSTSSPALAIRSTSPRTYAHASVMSSSGSASGAYPAAVINSRTGRSIPRARRTTMGVAGTASLLSHVESACFRTLMRSANWLGSNGGRCSHICSTSSRANGVYSFNARHFAIEPVLPHLSFLAPLRCLVLKTCVAPPQLCAYLSLTRSQYGLLS